MHFNPKDESLLMNECHVHNCAHESTNVNKQTHPHVHKHADKHPHKHISMKRNTHPFKQAPRQILAQTRPQTVYSPVLIAGAPPSLRRRLPQCAKKLAGLTALA